MTRAFSTLEMIIAMTIALMVMSGMFLVSFGNQSAILNGQTNAEATTIAQQLLEQQQANSKQDFSLVASVPPTTSGIYTKSVTVTPSADQLTKAITALVSWLGDHGQSLYVKLTTLVTDPQGAGGSCNPSLPGTEETRWKNPQMRAWEMVKDLVPVWPPANNFVIENVIPYKNHLFVVGGSLLGSNKGSYLLTFTITSDPTQAPVYVNGNPAQTPALLTPTLAPSQIANLPQALKVNGNYAYIASGRNYCTIFPDCGQLIVADISKVDTQQLAASDFTYFKIPGVVGSGIQGVGKSIYSDKGIIYVGLTKTPAGGGPEFNIIDVGGGSMGGTPTSPKLMGSYAVGAGVSSIYVSNGFAYITTGDNSTGNAVMVLDVSSPTAPQLKWTNIFGSSFGYANVFAASVNPLYVGYTYNSTNPELFILNNANPAAQKPSTIGPGLTLTGTNGIASMLVKSTLAFLITDNDFEVWNISGPSITQWATPLAYDGGGSGTASGCKGNLIYVGSRPSSADKAHIAVFYPGKDTQTITVNTHAPATAAYNSTFSVAATASSGLSVTVTVSGVCSISGNSITVTSGTGTCSIFYNQSGNYNYNAAPQITETTSATKADQTITFNSLPNKTFGDPDFSVSASASSGLAVSFASQTASVCTVSGSTVHIVTVGTCTIRASQSGDTNYNAAPNADQSFTVQKAPSTTTISCPASVTYTGSAQTPCTASVTGAGGLSTTAPVTYTNNVNVGTATANATYGGDANHLSSSDSKTFAITKATPTITWSNPAAITYGTALSGTQLNASTGVAGAFTYTPASGIVLNAEVNQTLSVHFVPTDTANYNTPADKTVNITVNKATPGISTTIFNATTNVAITHAPSGTSIYDKTTLTAGFGAPTGTVAFTVSTNKTNCGNPKQNGGTIALVAGVAKSSNYTTSGDTSYQAVYNGDINFNSVSATCEALPAP